MADNNTPNRGYQLPDAPNLLSSDVHRLVAALNAIDADMASMILLIAGKANASHTHAIGDVGGLQSALDGKATYGHTHAIGDLSDVSTTGAAAGYVIKRSGGQWVAAAVGISDIPGLQTALDTLQGQIDVIDGGTY